MDNGLSPVKLSKKAESTAKRYYGATAKDYNQRRAGQAKWSGEDSKVRELLSDLPSGARVLDVPCGTGRFFDLYRERGFDALGVDVSAAMLAECSGVPVRQGSIFALDLPDGSFDVALSIRFMNLIEADDMKIALRELQRVARRAIFTLRVKQKSQTGHYHSPHPITAVEDALLPGWSITRNDAVHEDDYRMVEIAVA